MFDRDRILATLFPPARAQDPLPRGWQSVAALLRQSDDLAKASNVLLAHGFSREAHLLEGPLRQDPELRSAFSPELEALFGPVRAGAGDRAGGHLPSAYVRGRFLTPPNEPPRPRYAGIGCRHPSPRAAAFAAGVAEQLSHSHTAISGGAPGCDAAFAAGSGRRSLAIMPCGIGADFGQLGDYGAVVSPFAEAEPFSRLGAMRRNGLITEAAPITLVASARPGEGGSWHAAVGALRRRHRVAVFIGEGAGSGARALAALGAIPVRDAEEGVALIHLAPAVPPWQDLGTVWHQLGGADLRRQAPLPIEPSLAA